MAPRNDMLVRLLLSIFRDGMALIVFAIAPSRLKFDPVTIAIEPLRFDVFAVHRTNLDSRWHRRISRLTASC